MRHHPIVRKADIATNLEMLGVRSGSTVMVHSSLRAIGPLLNGPQTLFDSLCSVIGEAGTIMVYTDWIAPYEAMLDADGHLPDDMKGEVTPFDHITSPAARDHGVFVEWVRQRAGANRSANPGASCAAIGKHAHYLTADHPQNFGYGMNSPFGKFTALDGDVLMLGAPKDTASILHHAEQMAQFPDKRVRRIEVPLSSVGRPKWRMIEEFDTTQPISPAFDENYFGTIVDAFLDQDFGTQAMVGNAQSLRLPARQLVPFAIKWMEQTARHDAVSGFTFSSASLRTPRNASDAR